MITRNIMINKKDIKEVIILFLVLMIGCFFIPGCEGDSTYLSEQSLSLTPSFGQDALLQANKEEPSSDLPFAYAQTAWPTIHRDSRNSNYLPSATTERVKPKWHALYDEYAAVIAPVVIGPEGNIYFTTGKEQEYGNLHAFNRDGHELWRSYLLDCGALTSSPLLGREGDLYLSDSDEFFSFSPDGTLKWICPGIEGPFASTSFSLSGFIIGINRDGLVYVFDPHDGQLAATPLELPGQSPGDYYRVPTSPGLWEGMVSDENDLPKSEIYNGLMGYQFKVTNTPAVNPVNGRIYIIGTVKNPLPPLIQGRLYGIDFYPPSGQIPGQLQLAFQSKMGHGSGSSPVISRDGSHIYTLDGNGMLCAFNIDGKRVWRLHIGRMPGSPTIGADGNIYAVSGKYLYAIKDFGPLGKILWEKNLQDKILAWLPDPSPFPEIKSSLERTSPLIVCNSVISASQNFLYLTVMSGYNSFQEGGVLPIFLPMESFLVVLTPPSQDEESGESGAIIKSIIELPDTTEGIITLDQDGTIFCTHASISSSIAYAFSQKVGFELRAPIGGVTVLEPERAEIGD